MRYLMDLLDLNNLVFVIRKNVSAYIFQFGKFVKEEKLKVNSHTLLFLISKKPMIRFLSTTFLLSYLTLVYEINVFSSLKIYTLLRKLERLTLDVFLMNFQFIEVFVKVVHSHLYYLIFLSMMYLINVDVMVWLLKEKSVVVVFLQMILF